MPVIRRKNRHKNLPRVSSVAELDTNWGYQYIDRYKHIKVCYKKPTNPPLSYRTVGLQQAEVMVKGAGSRRDVALRVIAKSGVRLSCTRDVTPMPHNGCRPPKKRHL